MYKLRGNTVQGPFPMSDWLKDMMKGGTTTPPRFKKDERLREIMREAKEMSADEEDEFWYELHEKMRADEEEGQLETKENQMMRLMNDDVGGYWETCYGIDKLFQTMVMKQILFMTFNNIEKNEDSDVYHWCTTTLLTRVTQPEWKTLVVGYFEEKTKLGDELASTIQSQIVDPMLSSYTMQFLTWVCAWRNFSVKSKEEKMKTEMEPVD